MKDLFLTPRGDLSIENIVDSKQRLEINFITSHSNALRLNFFIEDTLQKQNKENSLSINFKISEPENDKELRLIDGDMVMEQSIKIRLSTAIGSLRGNRSIGSKLELVMHELLDNDSLEEHLTTYIKNAISDLIEDPVIQLSKINTKYLDYSNGFTVTIIDKNKKYTIEL